MTIVDITKAEMDSFLEPLGFKLVDLGFDVKEFVYRKDIDTDTGLFVYSSIDKRSEVAREEGKDAIRAVILYKNRYPIAHDTHTKRTEGWDERLKEKITGLLAKVPKPVFCSQGHVMVVREGSRGPFLGCSEYPNHKETMALRKEGQAPPRTCPEGHKLVFHRSKWEGGRDFLGCEGYGKTHNHKFMIFLKPKEAGEAIAGKPTKTKIDFDNVPMAPADKLPPSTTEWFADPIHKTSDDMWFFKGGENGVYVQFHATPLDPQTVNVTAGTYEGAIPHIGDALFNQKAEWLFDDRPGQFGMGNITLAKKQVEKILNGEIDLAKIGDRREKPPEPQLSPADVKGPWPEGTKPGEYYIDMTTGQLVQRPEK